MLLSVRHSQINGETAVPGSKSHTIRALAIAALAKGTSVIKMPLVSDDTLSCLSAACDAAELIICQQHLIRCAGLVQVLICLRLFERLLPVQALCDVTEFHVMASHEEIFTSHVCVLSLLLCYELFTAQ